MSATTLLLAATEHAPRVPAIAVALIVFGILVFLLAITLLLGGGRPHD
ncbi:MAG TPA: hypothetical protein VIM10_16025 [Actinopolymorphaceae bacterium]|jgi:hypothetical protein